MAKVAIVDYGLGNLFSIQNACRSQGLCSEVTADRHTIEAADALILPGVGAFGDAMRTLHQLDLVRPIQDFAASGRPVLGVCLGIQLLLSESQEFGKHKGLGLIPGEVVSLQQLTKREMRIPHVGWNRLIATERGWQNTYLAGAEEPDYFYFVHSFVVLPAQPQVILTRTTYLDVSFCSSLQAGNLFACQFHPEKSGPAGLRIYKNLKKQLDFDGEGT